MANTRWDCLNEIKFISNAIIHNSLFPFGERVSNVHSGTVHQRNNAAMRRRRQQRGREKKEETPRREDE